MLSIIVHGERAKIILILQIHSHKTNCIFVALIDLAHFLSYENSRAGCSHSHMHAHSKGHAISQDRIRGRACAWPVVGVQNKVSHQEHVPPQDPKEGKTHPRRRKKCQSPCCLSEIAADTVALIFTSNLSVSMY